MGTIYEDVRQRAIDSAMEEETAEASVIYDIVSKPQHYNMGRYEVIDVIEDWHLDFHLSCVIKYLARSPHKGNELEDLRKAQWYLNRKIQLLEGGGGTNE